MKNRCVIGLVGPIASGKGVIAQYLKEQDFAYQSLSDRVREEVRKRGLEITRENLQNIGNLLREENGASVLAERSVSLLSSLQGNIVIDSIRNPAEIIFLKEYLGAIIIGVDAPEILRLAWYMERAKARGEDNPSPEDFYLANARDLGAGEGASGQQVGACLALSDFILRNDGSREQLFEQLFEVLNEIRQTPEGTGHSPEKI